MSHALLCRVSHCEISDRVAVWLVFLQKLWCLCLCHSTNTPFLLLLHAKSMSCGLHNNAEVTMMWCVYRKFFFWLRHTMYECCIDWCGCFLRYMARLNLYIVTDIFNVGIGLMNWTFEILTQEKITLSNVMRMKLSNHDLRPFYHHFQDLDQMFSSMYSCRILL